MRSFFVRWAIVVGMVLWVYYMAALMMLNSATYRVIP